MKYLLIDGNNLAIRSSCGNLDLTNTEGETSGVHYGVMQSLIGFKQKFNDYEFLVVWDGKSERRKKEASVGVELGMIKSGYKENRPTGDEKPQGIINFQSQSRVLKLAIDNLGIPQIRLNNYEADDVIASYCKKLNNGENEIICVTTDKDYFQLLDDKIHIWNGMKNEMITKTIWCNQNKIEPKQHVDVGALSGDTGDNIFGIPGWGEKTSLKYVQSYGGYKDVFSYLHGKYDSVRKDFPDVKGDEFKKLFNLCSEKEQNKKDNGEPWKGKYPEIIEECPFTGVALAFEEKRWKPKKASGVKNEILALMFEKRVDLAYSLKKMDSDIDDLPEIHRLPSDMGKIMEYLNYFDIYSIQDEIKVFS